MILPPFSLPSQPAKKIALREATVADALDFCDLDPRMEEAVTTLFLNRVQQPDGYFDAKYWTMDDRRLGLYWYWLHTTSDPTSTIAWRCDHCGDEHQAIYDFRTLADGYVRIKGRPEREIMACNELIMVRPLNGEDAEALELMRIDSAGADTPKAKAKIRLETLSRSVTFSSMPPLETDRLSYNRKRIEDLSISALQELTRVIADALMDMEHGLPTVMADGAIYMLIELPCQKKQEVNTRLRVPFRHFDAIPIL